MKMSLFSSLHLGREAISSYQQALDVVGQDIVNVGTPGHVRRTPVLQSQSLALGGGVRVAGFTTARDAHLESAYRREMSGFAMADAEASSLALLDGYFGDGVSPGLAEAMQRVYDSLSAASINGLTEVGRQEVIASVEGWAAGMRDAAETLERERLRANEQVRSEVQETNEILGRIAQLNRSLQETTFAGDKEPLKDRLTAALAELAEKVDFVTREAEGGGAFVSLTSGATLVSDRDAFLLEVQQDALNDGMDQVLVRGPSGAVRDVTALPLGGALGGYVKARDGVLKATGLKLDQITTDIVTRLNAVHQGGFDADGNAGGVMFEPLAVGPSGQAKSVKVSAALSANTRLLALASDATVTDVRNAGALHDTRGELLLDGGRTTIIDGLAKVGQGVGYAVADANAQRDLRAAMRDDAVGERDRRSATNLESSIVDLVRYQRGMQAAMGFMRNVDEMLDELLSLFR